jgi:hypothetical protein
LRKTAPADASLSYLPMLLGTARVYFANTRAGVTAETSIAALTPFADGVVAADFHEAELIQLEETDLEKSPADGASFSAPPPQAANPKSYDVWKKSFVDWLYRTQTLELFSNPSLKITSTAGENERDFRARLVHKAHELRDEFATKLRQKFAAKYATLNERIRRAEQAVERERAQASSSTLGTMIDVGASILGAFLGRKKVSATNLGRAAGAARKVGRTVEQRQDVNRAEANVEAAQAELERIEEQFNAETARHASEVEEMLADVQTVSIKPKKTDITVKTLGLAWAPRWQLPDGSTRPAWQ